MEIVTRTVTLVLQESEAWVILFALKYDCELNLTYISQNASESLSKKDLRSDFMHACDNAWKIFTQLAQHLDRMFLVEQVLVKVDEIFDLAHQNDKSNQKTNS